MATAHRTNATGQLKPLKDRLSPEQMQYRAAKTAVRQQLSLEHARTRGMAQMAFNNTIQLYHMQKRIIFVGGGIVLAQVGAVLYYFFGG